MTTDPGTAPHVLVYLQHSVVDGRTDAAGNRRVISKRFEFVSVDPEGSANAAGWAPYLDLRPATADEIRLCCTPVIDGGWVRADLEACRRSATGSGSPGRTWRKCDAGRSTASSGPPRPSRARLESEIQLLGPPRQPAQGTRAGRQAPAQRHELGEGAPAGRRASRPPQAAPRRPRRGTAAVPRCRPSSRRRAGRARRAAGLPARRGARATSPRWRGTAPRSNGPPSMP